MARSSLQSQLAREPAELFISSHVFSCSLAPLGGNHLLLSKPMNPMAGYDVEDSVS